MGTLIKTREKLTQLGPDTIEQQRIKARLEVYVNAEPQLEPEEIVSSIREEFPPEILYSKGALSENHAIYTILRDYLVQNNMPYIPLPHKNRVIFGLANSLYDNQEDKDTAVRHCKGQFNQQPIDVHGDNQARYHDSNRQRTTESNQVKLANHMSNRFKENDKYNGKLGENLSEAISNYREACRDYELTLDQRLAFLHHLFGGDAKRFFRERVEGRATSYAEAVAMMQSEFNSLTRQNRIRKHLQTLRLNHIVKEKNISTTKALEELRDEITRLAPQGPRTHQSEEDRTEYLYKAVVGAPWAKSALSMSLSANPPWTFQQLFTALDTAWLQNEEEVAARQRDGRSHTRTFGNDRYETPKPPGLFWETPSGMYGRPRRPGSKSSAPHSKQNFMRRDKLGNGAAGRNGLDRFGNPRLCNNCGDKDHFIRFCPKKRGGIMSTVGGMLQTNPSKATQILYELCVQTEDALYTSPDDELSMFFERDNSNTHDEDEEDIIDSQGDGNQDKSAEDARDVAFVETSDDISASDF